MSCLVDWAFYHHRFDNASIRVGRIPAPFGFLAETREVGTLLPFYQAPAGYYLEAIRNLDGLTLTNQHSIIGGQLETTLYGGGTSGTLLTWVPPGLPFSYVLTKARFERLVGAQMVYTTPIEGVRLLGGLSTLRFLDTAKVQTAGPAVHLDLLNAGVDARFDRVFARGEARRAKNGSNAKTYNYYLQTGIRPLQNLWINAQGDFEHGGQLRPRDRQLRRPDDVRGSCAVALVFVCPEHRGKDGAALGEWWHRRLCRAERRTSPCAL